MTEEQKQEQPNNQQPLANNAEKAPFIPPAHDPSAALHDGFAPGWGWKELFGKEE